MVFLSKDLNDIINLSKIHEHANLGVKLDKIAQYHFYIISRPFLHHLLSFLAVNDPEIFFYFAVLLNCLQFGLGQAPNSY